MRQLASRSFLSLVPAALLAALALCATSAVAETEAPVQTYGVRLYEVFQRGPKLVLEERTSRAFAPNHVRNIAVGEVFPPEGTDPIKVFKSRDHLEFFGSYFREDGGHDYGKFEVEVWEDAAPDAAGIAYVRLRIVPRAERGDAPSRRVRHPEHDDAQRGATK